MRGSLVRSLLAASCAWLALACASCGWHSGRIAPNGAHSVGVEIFGLDVRRDRVPVRDLEPEVHAELSRAVSDLVDLPVVESSRADLVVRGRILQYRRRGGIRSRDNELLETGVRIQLEAQLVDARSGAEIARTQSGLWSGHVVGGPASERAARERALASLCERIVLDLFAPSARERETDAAEAALDTEFERVESEPAATQTTPAPAQSAPYDAASGQSTPVAPPSGG